MTCFMETHKEYLAEVFRLTGRTQLGGHYLAWLETQDSTPSEEGLLPSPPKIEQVQVSEPQAPEPKAPKVQNTILEQLKESGILKTTKPSE